jgi:HSP20 family protein
MYLTTFDPFTRAFERRVFGAGSPAIALDGIRRENDVLLRFDVPGVDPETIEVNVSDGWLTVSAKREETAADGERFFIRERPAGSFTRRVRLSGRLDSAGIEANYRNGVLEVRVPVAEEAKPRKIAIQTADATGELTA